MASAVLLLIAWPTSAAAELLVMAGMGVAALWLFWSFCALYLLMLAIGAALAAPRARRATSDTPFVLGEAPSSRICIVIPAHDEELLIGTILDGLGALRYPAELHRIVVIADNCEDDTAVEARGHGAEVL